MWKLRPFILSGICFELSSGSLLAQDLSQDFLTQAEALYASSSGTSTQSILGAIALVATAFSISFALPLLFSNGSPFSSKLFRNGVLAGLIGMIAGGYSFQHYSKVNRLHALTEKLSVYAKASSEDLKEIDLRNISKALNLLIASGRNLRAQQSAAFNFSGALSKHRSIFESMNENLIKIAEQIATRTLTLNPESVELSRELTALIDQLIKENVLDSEKASQISELSRQASIRTRAIAGGALDSLFSRMTDPQGSLPPSIKRSSTSDPLAISSATSDKDSSSAEQPISYVTARGGIRIPVYLREQANWTFERVPSETHQGIENRFYAPRRARDEFFTGAKLMPGNQLETELHRGHWVRFPESSPTIFERLETPQDLEKVIAKKTTQESPSGLPQAASPTQEPIEAWDSPWEKPKKIDSMPVAEVREVNLSDIWQGWNVGKCQVNLDLGTLEL